MPYADNRFLLAWHDGNYDFITSDGVKKKIKVEKVGTPVMLNQNGRLLFLMVVGHQRRLLCLNYFLCINTKTKELSISQVQLPI